MVALRNYIKSLQLDKIFVQNIFLNASRLTMKKGSSLVVLGG